MADDLTYTDLSVAVRERPDAGQVEFGVVVDGAFVPFAAGKLGGFHEDLQEAREQAQQQQAAQPQESGNVNPPATGSASTTTPPQ